MKLPMKDYLEEMKKFFSRGDISNSQYKKLLGKERPMNIVGSFLKPYDSRFESVILKPRTDRPNRIDYIIFRHPAAPTSITEAMDVFGLMMPKYDEGHKNTYFVTEEYEGSESTNAFSVMIENKKIIVEDGYLMEERPDGKKMPLDPANLMFTGFRFHFIDRDPIPDPPEDRRR